MEDNINNSTSHVARVVALPGCSASGLNAAASTSRDLSHTPASAAAQVVVGASSPQAPAQQCPATCKLDGCSDAAVFVFEGDTLGSYCQVHKPIMEPLENRTQVSGVRRDRQIVMKLHKQVRTSTSTRYGINSTTSRGYNKKHRGTMVRGTSTILPGASDTS